MKKLLSVLLALSLVLTMAFAAAETTAQYASYLMVAASDADGNTVDITNANLPVLILVIDLDSNVCTFGTEDGQAEGTYEYVTGDDSTTVLNVSLTDGNEYTMTYSADEDAFYLVDSENGLTYGFANLETLADAVDAQ